MEFKKGKEARCLLRYRQGRLLMCILTNYGRIFIFDLCLIRYIRKSCISIFRHIVMNLLQLMRKSQNVEGFRWVLSGITLVEIQRIYFRSDPN